MRSCLVLAMAAAAATGCVMPRSMALGQMAAPVGRGAMEVGVFTGVQYGGQSEPPFTTTDVGGATLTNQKSNNAFALPGAEANLQYGFTEWRCEWMTVVPAFKDAVDARGHNEYRDVNGHTELRIFGELKVDAAKVKGVPRLLAGTVGPAVESFLVGRIRPNFVTVAQGVEKFLASRK
ncbi:MAG: hypothetical protein IT380_28725 [Myxococcales bacterium]|nr:hypothetical protein [Myxococcales bacterium]